MTHWLDLFDRHDWYDWLDHTEDEMVYDRPNTALMSFALDDAIATAVGKGAAPAVIRLWSHDNTIVLGIPDTKLPRLEAGVDLLNQHGFKAMVRNSGGLAVALDRGVLNLSLIFPDARHLSIENAYKAMTGFVRDMFADVTDAIEAYEIVGSYCPGDYDLSIGGKKFAGISQRRVRDAVAVQIYIDIFGDSQQRAALIRDFYHTSLAGSVSTFTYPSVTPDVMGSLNDLLGLNLTRADVKQRAHNVLKQGGLVNKPDHPAPFDPNILNKRTTMMERRNADIAAIQSE